LQVSFAGVAGAALKNIPHANALTKPLRPPAKRGDACGRCRCCRCGERTQTAELKHANVLTKPLRPPAKGGAAAVAGAAGAANARRLLN
jgi:hypothetical protein